MRIRIVRWLLRLLGEPVAFSSDFYVVESWGGARGIRFENRQRFSTHNEYRARCEARELIAVGIRARIVQYRAVREIRY